LRRGLCAVVKAGVRDSRSTTGYRACVRFRSVLFAAGRGRRLRPLSDRIPKPAIPLLDVPVGAFGLDALLGSCGPVAVNLSHRADDARRALSSHAPPGAVEFFHELPEAYGTAATLRALREQLDRTVVTFNADVVTDLEVTDLLAAHQRAGAGATIAVRPVETGADVVTRRGWVEQLIDRRVHSGRRGHLFAGVAAWERSVLGEVDARRPLGLTEGLLAPLVRRGEVAAFEHRGYWVDVGTPARYLRASLDMLAHAGAQPWLRVGATGTRSRSSGGPVWRGPGVACEGAHLGDGAILLAGCRVAAGARVARSVVWRDENVPSGASLRDVVWFGGCALPEAEPTGASGR